MIEYELIRSNRKTLAVQVGIDGKVTVRVPLRLSEKQISTFLAEREDWIIKTVQKQLERGKNKVEFSENDIKILREKALKELPPRVEYYSRIMGVKPTGFHITSAKTRYGSCSGKNSINFSLYLMAKDEKAVDYVVVHELAHIKHHNHSKEFYKEIEKILPDYKEREKLLKL